MSVRFSLKSSGQSINVKSFITNLVAKVKAAFALPEPAMGLAFA